MNATPKLNEAADGGSSPVPCSASSCGCEKCENYQKYLAWKKRENASDGGNELVEENRHLKDQLATLSKTHAKDRQRLDELLSDYVRDKRIIGEALGLTGENVMIHWFQLRAIHSLQNAKSDAPT
jgi:hypothetical protein